MSRVRKLFVQRAKKFKTKELPAHHEFHLIYNYILYITFVAIYHNFINNSLNISDFASQKHL